MPQKNANAKEWPASFVRLIGAWAEDDFPSLEEIRGTERPDIPRELGSPDGAARNPGPTY